MDSRNRLKGFSLTEVLFSIGLLGLILIFVINLVPGSVVTVKSGDARLGAEVVARSLIEEARARPFSDLAPGTVDNPISVDPRYTVTREIFSPTGLDASQSVGVRIRVSWEEARAQKEVVREIWLSAIRS